MSESVSELASVRETYEGAGKGLRWRLANSFSPWVRPQRGTTCACQNATAEGAVGARVGAVTSRGVAASASLCAGLTR